MKKFIFIMTAILLLISCDPAKFMREHVGYWYIKNNSDYPINVSIINTEKLLILPKDSIEFLSYNVPVVEGEPPFDRLFSGITWDEYDEQERRITIFSEKGEVLKTWYITEKDEPGKHLFKEEYWKLYMERNGDKSNTYRWVFEIVQEDLAPINEE